MGSVPYESPPRNIEADLFHKVFVCGRWSMSKTVDFIDLLNNPIHGGARDNLNVDCLQEIGPEVRRSVQSFPKTILS